MPDQSQNARKLAEVYLDQPIKLPDPVRARIEAALGGPVLLYALADLDASLNLARTWVALGENAVALCAEEGGPDPRLVPRASVAEVRERASLACTSLHLVGADGEALASWRFTHRQRRGMANLQFILGDDAKARNAAGGEAPRAPLPAPDPAKADASYFESLLAPVRKAQALVVPNQMAVVWRLLGYIKPYRWPVAAGMVAAALLALVGLAPPYLTGDLIKLFDGGALDPAVAPEAERLLWLITGSLAAALVFLWIRLHSLAILGEYVARDLRRDVYDRIQSLSVGYFSQHQTGSIISRVNSDTDRIWEFIAFGVVEVSLSLLRLAAMSAVLIALDYRLGLAMVLPLPILLWGIVANGQTMQKLFTAAWRKWSDLNDVVAGTIPGIRVVKAFNQEDHERKRFGGRNAEMTETFNAVHRNWTKFWPALMLGVHAITVGVYWLALPRLFGDGPAPLDLGTFVAFLLYMGMFWQPIEVFGQMARMLNRSLSSARRVFELIDTEPEMLERRDAAKLDPMRGAIEFEGVTFGYDPLRPVLRGISFKAEPGEMIGLAGPSGAGKTTLVNLIARFYDPAEGKIRADGIDLRDLDVGAYRRQIGMVQQDPFLFHGTILDNIRYGLPEADFHDVIEAARAANAHEFIAALPQGYDTVVGERGHTLSGGERQRVSIARAILHDPRLLILDEATSSVDSETEKKIQEAMDRLADGRTTFAIAHRLSTLRKADRILVIKDGRIAESGTHDDLMGVEGGIYRKMAEMQGSTSGGTDPIEDPSKG